MQQSIQISASVRSLRTLEVSHAALCPNGTPGITIKKLVQHCKPLLRALNDEFVEKDLNATVFDVIDIVLPHSVCQGKVPCRARYDHPRKVFIDNWAIGKSMTFLPRLQCKCHCRNAQETNNELKLELP